MATRETYCESCQRVRSAVQQVGAIAVASYSDGSALYIVAADVEPPVANLDLLFTALEDGTSYVVAVSPTSSVPAAVVVPVLETADTPPAEAVLATSLLTAPLPQVALPGYYRIELVDRYSSTSTHLTDLFLEANVTILFPQQAELGGAPRAWLQGYDVDSTTPGQPAGAPRITIPFDKCTAVLEYDARLGSLPDAQGWTLMGVGSINDYSIVEGRALRFNTVSASYFERAVTLAAAPTRSHCYALVYRDSFLGTRGFELQALHATAGGAYSGSRIFSVDAGVWRSTLAGTTNVLLAGRPQGWESIAGSAVSGGLIGAAYSDPAQSTAAYGTTGTAGATELRVRFGDTAGAGLVGYARGVVASTPGRFIRAHYVGFAEGATPVARFYMSRHTGATGTARFKIAYGQGASPYEAPTTTVGATLSLATANALYPLAVALPGLEAQQPFWFTIERDWTHGDDVLDTTVHLHYLTLRAR